MSSPMRRTVATLTFKLLEMAWNGSAEWVHWYNTNRLMDRLDLKPPLGYEAEYDATTRDGRSADHT